MKLGDNMAPIEACNSWNDVCRRKTRPPKIGDIPRHVAVDEESPGSSSSSRSVVQVGEPAAVRSMLERSAAVSAEHAESPLESFMKPPPPPPPVDPSRELEQVESIPGEDKSERAESSKTSFSSNSSIPLGKALDGPRSIFQETSTNRSPESQLKSLGETESTLYDNELAEEFIQVRKDSALYIDEKRIEKAAELRDSLVWCGMGVPPRSTSGLSHRTNLDESLPSRLSGQRTRRESSGYFSNLGTFDEERWPAGSAPSDLANQQQDAPQRRRSSTKNRLPMGLGQQQTNRVTSTALLACPLGNETSEKDASKSVRVDMPNIDERSSFEIDKSLQLDRSVDNDVEDQLAKKIRQISLENSSSPSIRLPAVSPEKLSSVKREESTELGGKLASADLGVLSSTASRVTGRLRDRTVVHRYSSPNITNSELKRIVERPHGQNFVRSRTEFQEVESTSPRLGDCEEDEDDNEQVVVADLEGSYRGGDDGGDSRKLLPRSVKVYQLLSTQSEDRGDGDARLFDRRISLQIQRQDEEAARENAGAPAPNVVSPSVPEYPEEKRLVHADSVPILKIPSSDASDRAENEMRLCAGGSTPSSDNPSGAVIPGIRPIYPYCPYSPYASPQGSPRTNRRRPLRESRRVSIDSRQGALQLNQYKLLNNIGQGSYGIVKLAYNEEDETHYAMKILSKKKLMKKAGIFGRIAPGRKGVTNPLAKVYREIALLKKLDHPNVVKLVEVLDDPDEDNLYLVFELVQKGEVLQLPTDKPLDQETARIHFRDVVMGVEYLHYQRIVHRDIKPSNLLVDAEGRVKVADLGVSAELRAAGELLSGSAGTPAFAAPETTTPGAQYSGTLCDVWSMGVTLYSLVTGKVPWDGSGSIIGVQSAVRSEPLRFPQTPCLSEELRDLVSRMLNKDPSRRITLAEIKEHSWLTKNGEEPLPNEVDNCRLPVTVTDEEVARVVTRVPKLDTLILIKTMLKQHSFQNPFLPRRIVRSGCTGGDVGASAATLKQQVSSDTTDSSTELLATVETLKSKTQQFHKVGRCNSAPDSYEWQTNGKQISSDSLLPPVTEFSSQEQAEVEKR